jgi:hypothetical protein
MATAHACRKGRHNYEALAGTVAGLGRRTCATCGSVQIDIRDRTDEVEAAAYVFTARRPTLFSVRPDGAAEESMVFSSGFRARSRRR